MYRQNLTLGRVFGIPIRLDVSWFLVLALFTWTLAVSYFPKEFKGWPVFQYWVVGAVAALVLFGSVLLHELAHSLIALRYKITVRGITLFIFGGIAEITTEPPYAAAEFWIAIAGPLASFALAFFFRLLQTFFAGMTPLLALARYLAIINGSIALFNLIPGFPLDGGRIFRAFLWKLTRDFQKATLMAAAMGRAMAFLFLPFGVWQILAGNIIGGFWIVLIGLFLDHAAISQLQQQQTHKLLAGHTVFQAMDQSYMAISADATLRHLVDDYILDKGKRAFLVESGGNIVGLLTIHQIQKVPQSEWSITKVSQAMLCVDQLKVVQPGTALWTALEAMDRAGVNQLPVIEEGRVMGMLTREGVISYIRTLRELNV